MNKKMHTYNQNFNTFFDCDLDIIEINREKKNRRSTTEEFIEKAKLVHGDNYDYSTVNYINRSTNILIKCKKHGVEFWQTPTNHLSGWFGCPHCGYGNITRGEQRIKEFLEKNQIEYVYQKRFSDCKYKRTLRFDFWLPKLKTIIEYDGKKHYFPINFFGGEYCFEQIQITDKIKNDYAEKNGYSLLRITYAECGNISDILKNKINNK